jgi:hypothetical protein
LDPNGWKIDYIGFVWHKEKFKLPKHYQKLCKIKSDYMYFISDNGKDENFCDIAFSSWRPVIYYIEKYYQQF